MTTETEKRLRAVRFAIARYRDAAIADAGHMPAARARAAVVDVIRDCDAAIADALHALAVESEDADAEQRWAACDAQLVACDGGCGRVLQPRRVVEDHEDSWCVRCVEREEREADRCASQREDAEQARAEYRRETARGVL